MIGTALGGQGGVAAVVGVHEQQGLFDRFGVRYVATHREGSRWQKLVCSIVAAIELFWLLLTRRVSIVHAHVASNASFRRKAILLAMARAFGVPTIFHLHGGGFKEFAEVQASATLRRRIVRTLQSSSVVVTLSSDWASFVRGLAPMANVRIIANPVRVPADQSATREEPGRVLFLGRASEAKGVFDLLAAAAAVRADVPELRLALGGDGDLEQVARRASELGLQQCVELLGWVSGDAKDAELARAQVFVLPSYNEGLPMAMLEAMAYGKAVVVSAVGGIPEAVQHEQQGLLIQPGNVPALAQAMSTLLRDSRLRIELGVAARKRVLERFSADHVIELMSRLYLELGVVPMKEFDCGQR